MLQVLPQRGYQTFDESVHLVICGAAVLPQVGVDLRDHTENVRHHTIHWPLTVRLMSPRPVAIAPVRIMLNRRSWSWGRGHRVMQEVRLDVLNGPICDVRVVDLKRFCIHLETHRSVLCVLGILVDIEECAR